MFNGTNKEREVSRLDQMKAEDKGTHDRIDSALGIQYRHAPNRGNLRKED
jgi:hypothetical protein